MSETHTAQCVRSFFFFFENNNILSKEAINQQSKFCSYIVKFSPTCIDGCYRLFIAADAGQDEPEAEGNDDGHPTKNNVFNNKIWTDSDEAIRMTNADGNDIYVSISGHSF